MSFIRGLFKLGIFIVLIPVSCYIAWLLVTMPNILTNTYPAWNKTWWIGGMQWVLLAIVVLMIARGLFRFICKLGSN